MIKKIILYPVITFVVLVIQYVIFYFFSKEKNKFQFKEQFISIIGASLFIGVMFALTSELFNWFNYKIILVILTASIISSYWFIINPLKHLFIKKKYFRDIGLENEMKLEGYNFKILFTDQITSNAYATGIIPFYKIIIIGQNLKEKLTKSQLKSIIYHEIGHHEKRHILKLFFVNVILQTIFFLMFYGINSIHYQVNLLHPLLVAIAGGTGGFLLWVVPNKISFYLEYQADRYSATHFGKNIAIESLVRLDELSGGKLTRGNANHPNLKKRVKNIEAA